MNITQAHGVSEFGYGRNRHSVEYNEVTAQEGGVTITFRRYPNNTVIQYKSERKGRKHKITSKMDNSYFGPLDVYEIFHLLGVETKYDDRIEVVELLKRGAVPRKTYY